MAALQTDSESLPQTYYSYTDIFKALQCFISIQAL